MHANVQTERSSEGKGGGFFEAVVQGVAIEFAQKSQFGAGQHALQSAARQKRAVAALRAETFDQRLIVERADHLANSDVAGIARQSHAALRAADAFDISGGGELLQHFRHMVARNAEMIGDRRRAHHFRVAVREEDEGAQAKVGEGRQPHGVESNTVFVILKYFMLTRVAGIRRRGYGALSIRAMPRRGCAGTSPAMTDGGIVCAKEDGPSSFETPAAQAPQDEGRSVAPFRSA